MFCLRHDVQTFAASGVGEWQPIPSTGLIRASVELKETDPVSNPGAVRAVLEYKDQYNPIIPICTLTDDTMTNRTAADLPEDRLPPGTMYRWIVDVENGTAIVAVAYISRN